MKLGPRFNVLGKVWRLVWVGLGERPRSSGSTMGDRTRGECEHPEVKGKKIFVRDHMPDAETLEVLIHEQLHAAGFVLLSEEWVTHTAHDLARNVLKVFDVKRKT